MIGARRSMTGGGGESIRYRTESDQLQQRTGFAFAVEDVGLPQVERRQWRWGRCRLRVERCCGAKPHNSQRDRPERLKSSQRYHLGAAVPATPLRLRFIERCFARNR